MLNSPLYQKILIGILIVILLGLLSGLGYYFFFKSESIETTPPVVQIPCGDGLCDFVESHNSELCPEDCREAQSDVKPPINPPVAPPVTPPVTPPATPPVVSQPLYFFYTIHTHTETGDQMHDKATYKLNAGVARSIADVLAEHGAKGTFEPVYGFAEGALKYEGKNNILVQLVSEGHEVGTHFHRNSDIEKTYNAVVAAGIVPRTSSGILAEVRSSRTQTAQEAFSEGLKIVAGLGMDVTTENLNLNSQGNPFGGACTQMGEGNIESLQTHNLMHPWLLDYPNQNICRHNPQADVVAVDHISIIDIFTRGSPDVLAQENFDKIKTYFDAALKNTKSNQVNVWGFVTHIKEYSKGEDAVAEKQALDALDQFLTYVDQYVKTGQVKYATASEIADVYFSQ